jgi:hypothetical protein
VCLKKARGHARSASVCILTQGFHQPFRHPPANHLARGTRHEPGPSAATAKLMPVQYTCGPRHRPCLCAKVPLTARVPAPLSLSLSLTISCISLALKLCRGEGKHATVTIRQFIWGGSPPLPTYRECLARRRQELGYLAPSISHHPLGTGRASESWR